MKCSYCGLRKGQTRQYRAIKLQTDTVLDMVCSECKGQYKTIRLQQLIRRGRTLAQARAYIIKLNLHLWSDEARQVAK